MVKVFEQDPFESEEGSEGEPDLSILNPDQNKKIIIEPTFDSRAPLVAGSQQAEALKTKIEELPNMEVEFKIVDDKSSKIVSLKEVESQMLDNDKMDTAIADIVNESFTGLYETVAPRNGFTKIPTKVNFKEVRTFVSERIAKEEAELMDLFKAYVDDPITGCQELLQKTREEYYPALLRITTSLTDELKKNYDKIVNNQSAIVPMHDGTFVNLSNDNLLKFDVSAFKTSLTSGPLFQHALISIRAALECPYTKRLILQTLGKEETEDSISMADLVKFTLSEEVFNEVMRFEENMTNMSNSTTELVEQVKQLSAQPDKVTEFVVCYGPAFLKFSHETKKLSSVVYHLTILNLAIKQMILTYLEL